MKSLDGRERGRRGGALVFAVGALSGLMMMTAVLFGLGVRLEAQLDSDFDDLRARYLAEAGLNEGLAALRAGGSGNVGTLVQPAYLGDGLLWVEATPLGGVRTQLKSTALVGSGRSALEAVVEVEAVADPLFVGTLNSKETLTLNSDVTIDSFDSSLGDYTLQAVNLVNGRMIADQNGDSFSNEDVVLNARAHVYGDATPGPGHSVFFNTDSLVSGSTTPASVPFTFPPLTSPVVPSTGPLVVPSNGSVSLPPGSHGFDAVQIGNGGTLFVEGPADLVVTDFSGLKDARLEIDARNGPVTIHVSGIYSHGKGFEAVPAPNSPMAVAFLIEATQNIVFPSATKIRGAYYGPEANVTFTSSNEAWGAFAFNRIEMSNAMQLHFDEHLMEHWEADTGQAGGGGDVLAWVSSEVLPAQLRSNRRDPFWLLGLDRAALPSPGDARWDP